MSCFYIEKINLNNFRCYESVNYAFCPHINIVVGNNAVGKTSLVEAIYYLALGKSHKATNEKETIQYDKDYSTIKAIVVSDKNKANILFSTTNEHKKIKVNSKTYTSLSSYIGFFRVVMFCPEDLEIIKGSPIERRKFLDVNLSQLDKEYLKDLIKYRKLLKQRNEILKNIGTNSKYDTTLLQIVTNELVAIGKKVILFRQQMIKELNPFLEQKIRSISDESETASMLYLPSVGIEKIEEEFKSKQNLDIAAKTTTIGPHRDDFIIYLNGQNVAKYGSQGQQRTAALALKLAVADVIKKIDDKVIIILDDVFSELDKTRQERLLEVLNCNNQIFITTTSLDLIRIDKNIDKLVIEITKDGEQNE